MPADKPYSDATAQAIDKEARSIVIEAYKRTLDLIRERRTEVEQVALSLLKSETIAHDDIVDLVGPRPFEGDAQYNEIAKCVMNKYFFILTGMKRFTLRDEAQQMAIA